MYQSRIEDLDKRIAVISTKGEALKTAFEDVEKRLKVLEEIDTDEVEVQFWDSSIRVDYYTID